MANQLGRQALFYATLAPFVGFFASFAWIIYPLRNVLHPTALCDKLSLLLPLGFAAPIAVFRNWCQMPSSALPRPPLPLPSRGGLPNGAVTCYLSPRCIAPPSLSPLALPSLTCSRLVSLCRLLRLCHRLSHFRSVRLRSLSLSFRPRSTLSHLCVLSSLHRPAPAGPSRSSTSWPTCGAPSS
eukprot:6245196-Prymnesium_polylepis.1